MDWIYELGSKWDIGPEFFIYHAMNTQGVKLWDSVMNTDLLWSTAVNRLQFHRQVHIEDKVPHLSDPNWRIIAKWQVSRHRVPRLSEWDCYYGWQSNAGTVYPRVSEYLCKSGHPEASFCH